MKKLIITLAYFLWVGSISVNSQVKPHFDSMLDFSFSFSTNANKYTSLGLGGTAGVRFLNDWLFLGAGAKIGYDKYEFPLLDGKYYQGTIFLDTRLYIPIKDMAQTYIDFKLGTCGADPKISEETNSTITTYKNLILGGPYKSLGVGIRIPTDDIDVGLGISYDYYELTVKHKKEAILGAGLVENFTIKAEYYF